VNTFHKDSLAPLPYDARDFHLGQLIDYPKLEDIPSAFSLGPTDIKDQIADGNDDMCTAYATCTASQYQEHVILYPAYSFALSKAISGNPEAWGQNLRDAHAAHVKYGALAFADTPESVMLLSPQDRRYLVKYPADLQLKARVHKKKAYVDCKGPYDAFNNIRAAIWAFRHEKRAVNIGVLWNWPLEDFKIDSPALDGYGHALCIRGFVGDFVECVQSAGNSAGQNGIVWIHKDVINRDIPKYGGMMFIDHSPEEIRQMIEDGVKLTDNWLLEIYKRIKGFIRDIVTRLYDSVRIEK
jgi:hypothetical protein